MKKEYELPYEKFLTLGAENLSEAELLAIILRTGTQGKDALLLAKEILQISNQYKGILGLQHISLNELLKIKGIGEVKAVKIKCIAELSKRMAEANAEKNLQMDKPSTVADFYMERLRHQETEQVILIMVNGKNQLIEDCVISKGSVNASILSSREIFLQALRSNAVYIMLLHNHPSGDPTPSKQDIIITERIRTVAELMEIPLLDHIIIGDNCYTSLREKGLM